MELTRCQRFVIKSTDFRGNLEIPGPTPEGTHKQTVLPSEFKRGMVLMLDGAPQMLEEFHVSGTAQTKQKLHTRLRHLKTGRLIDHTFPEGERVPVADVQHRRVQFSYPDGQDFVFSDVERLRN